MAESRDRSAEQHSGERVFLATNNGDIGGGEVMLLNIAAALESLGVPVTVVGPTEPPGVITAAREAGHDVIELEASGRKSWMSALRRWDAARRDGLLWCNGLVPAVATAGRLRRIVHLHQRPVGFLRALAPLARARALATLVPSESMAEVVPGATVFPNWSAPVELENRRARADGVTVLGFLGRPSPDKGVPVLARAVASLDRRSPGGYRLVLAGEPRFVSERARREVDAALEPVSSLVERPGWIDPSSLFSRIDLLIVPSVWPEPFGLVVTEALSARVPVLVSDAGALPEVLGPGSPDLVPAGDAEALADGIVARVERGLETDVEIGHARWQEHFSPLAGRCRVEQLLIDVGQEAEARGRSGSGRSRHPRRR